MAKKVNITSTKGKVMKKIIFIDRDGVINKDPGGWTEHSYVEKEEEFIFVPGSVEALKKLKNNNYEMIIISNQGGISKGYYTEEALIRVTNLMKSELKKENVEFEKIYYCIHQDSDNCDCKKPKTGMFKQAEKELNIKARGNYFIGDGKMDVEAGSSMGLKTILVLSGKTSVEDMKSWQIKPDYIFHDLKEAVDFIIEKDE